MKTNRPLVVWSRRESHTADGVGPLSVEVKYAWQLSGGCDLELDPPPEETPWKFVMVIPEGFPLTGESECRVAGCRRYNVGGSGHAHVISSWVVIRTAHVEA